MCVWVGRAGVELEPTIEGGCRCIPQIYNQEIETQRFPNPTQLHNPLPNIVNPLHLLHLVSIATTSSDLRLIFLELLHFSGNICISLHLYYCPGLKTQVIIPVSFPDQVLNIVRGNY